jgi:uncharacterized membrane protein
MEPAQDEEQRSSAKIPHRRRWYHVDYGGVVLGLVFGGLSMTPSLLPRPITAQGLIAGLSFAFGYMIGALLWFVGKKVVTWRPPQLVQKYAWWFVLVAWIIGAVALGVAAVEWQNDVRAHVGAEPISGENWLQFTIAAFVTVAACLGIGRLVKFGAQDSFRRFHRALSPRHTPKRALVYSTLGSAVVVAAGIGTVSALLVTSGLVFVDHSYAQKYGAPRPTLVEPSSEFRSAGQDSLIAWERVGRDGADILSTAPSAAQIAAVTGIPAIEPIRVYVGINNAPSPEERARAAVAELDRLNAEQRAVLVVAGTTGTGWLDPAAIDSLEYLHAGNTALVAVQYADTPSWRSSLFTPEVPVEANRILFDAVHDWWEDLPSDARPLLVVYGMSLGATAIQGAFEDAEDLMSRVDGAVFAGSPSNTPLWREVTTGRDAGSPVVLPVYEGGEHIRFFSQSGDFADDDPAWAAPRIAYLQHGSDPVTWGGLGVFVREPEWLKPGQRSEHISPYMRWIPVVSGLQTFVDFLLGQAVPDDAGHKYGNVMIDAWMSVTGSASQLTPDAVEKIRAVIVEYPTVSPTNE